MLVRVHPSLSSTRNIRNIRACHHQIKNPHLSVVSFLKSCRSAGRPDCGAARAAGGAHYTGVSEPVNTRAKKSRSCGVTTNAGIPRRTRVAAGAALRHADRPNARRHRPDEPRHTERGTLVRGPCGHRVARLTARAGGGSVPDRFAVPRPGSTLRPACRSSRCSAACRSNQSSRRHAARTGA